MKDTVKFKDYLKEELKDPEFYEAFDEEEVYASLAIQIAKIRQKKKLTQKKLAKQLHTTQQTISSEIRLFTTSCFLSSKRI